MMILFRYKIVTVTKGEQCGVVLANCYTEAVEYVLNSIDIKEDVDSIFVAYVCSDVDYAIPLSKEAVTQITLEKNQD